MSLTPAITIHLVSAAAVLALGPVALWARQGARARPRLHRAFGYAWVTMMLVAATSALFIHDPRLPGLFGFSPIHLLVPFVYYGLYRSFAALARGDIAVHRQAMQGLYYQACVGAGVFALLPQRFLGQIVWGQWLGLPSIAVWPLLAAMVVMAVIAHRASARPSLIAN
ncbi:MAG: DUF2306 domain-containing protein [Burkholderiales bacterium]|nr:DUF2306 domain-containing protein [Burkholderiales bacterium]